MALIGGFKSSNQTTDPARRPRKGRRNPGAAEWAGGVRKRMHWATGRRREAKGGDGSGRHVSEEGRQVKGGAASGPWGRGSSRCPPGPRAPDPLPGLEGGLGGLQPVPAAQPPIRTSHTIRCFHRG